METLWQKNGAEAGDLFGHRTSPAGDVNADGVMDVLVGAWRASPGGISRAGSAYVYSGINGTLLLQWNGSHPQEALGKSICAVGDVNGDGFDDILLGAPGADTHGLEGAGFALLCSGRDGSPLYKWNGVEEQGAFGSEVARVGDLNGDGLSDVLISASGLGEVYAFTTGNGDLLREWHGSPRRNGFGVSIAALRDLDHDGIDEVLIGAHLSGGSAPRGAAYLYSGRTGNLLMQWKGLENGDGLGRSVSRAGDLNGDGLDDILIGAPLASANGLPGSGSAYAFSGEDGELLFQWDGLAAGDAFGHSVSNAGDVNGDGRADVIVGAYLADKGSLADAGMFTIFNGRDGSDLLHRRGQEEFINFGNSVCAVGDINQDGRDDVMVGIFHFNPGGKPQAGSAVVLGFNPFMEVNTQVISTSAGGELRFGFNFPLIAAGFRYKVLLSLTGIGPTQFGVNIPLSLDRAVLDSFVGIYPVNTNSQLHGFLDSQGGGHASMTFDSNLPVILTGHTLWFATIANAPGELPSHTSIVIPVVLAP